MSISELPAFFGRAAVVLVSFVASVPVAEAIFRLIGDVPSYDLQGLYVPFDNGSYKLGPTVNTEALWASGRVAVHTDELGLRTDAQRRFAVKSGDAVDILLIGDSQGFGNGVNYEDSVAGSLAERAMQSGYRVGNASVGGHSLKTQLRLVRSLQEEGRLKVSHLVALLTPVMMGGCDYDTRAMVGQDGRLYGAVPGVGTRLRTWLKSHVVLYSRIRDAVRNSGIGTDPARGSPTVFDYYRPGAIETETREKLYSCLKTLLDYATPRELTVHVVYLPSVVEADFAPLRHAAAATGLALDPDVPYRTYSAVAGRLGLRTIDLRPALNKARADGDSLTVKADFHYSAVLSKAVSATVWAALDLPPRPLGRK